MMKGFNAVVLLAEGKSLGYRQVLLLEILGIQFENRVTASKYIWLARQG